MTFLSSRNYAVTENPFSINKLPVVAALRLENPQGWGVRFVRAPHFNNDFRMIHAPGIFLSFPDKLLEFARLLLSSPRSLHSPVQALFLFPGKFKKVLSKRI